METCSFLGYTYNYSLELFNLHAIYAAFSQQQADMFKTLEKMVDTVEKPGMVNNDGNDEMIDAFRLSATRIVSSLCDKGVASYTVSDFLDKNPAYSKYKDLAVETAKSYMQIIFNVAKSYMNEVTSARNSAEATITGTGTRIITNSMTSALLYNVIEYKTVSNQIASAEAKYKQKVREITGRSDRRQAEMEQDYKFHTWLPAARELIYEFVSYNLKQYLQILHETDQLKSDTKVQIDTNRSTTLLENCSLTDNKRAVLIEAFQADPFNLEVYTTTFKLGVFTTEEYKTLEIFGMDAGFSEFLRAEEKRAISPTSDVPLEERMLFLSKLYAVHRQDKNLNSFISGKLSAYLTARIDCYKTTILSEEVRKTWVKENVAANLETLATLSSEEIEEKIKGRLPLEEKKSSVGRLFEENLITDKDLGEVRREAFKNYFDYCIEFQELYRKYKVLSEDYDAKFRSIKKEISNCEDALHKCGLLDFKKKRLIQSEHSRLDNELEELKPQFEEIWAMRSKINSF